MSNIPRFIVVVLLTGHGLIHLLGAAKGFGWAEVTQLSQPIGPAVGVLWLVAAVLVLAAAALLAAGTPTWWWALAGAAALASQLAIATSWGDAKAGTVINVLLVLGAAYGFASVGPTSYHAQWQHRAARALAEVEPNAPDVTEADLSVLPEPLAAYVRRSGAVGKAKVTSLRADFHGRIRGGPDAAWMPFTGKQVNTYGPKSSRSFIIVATRLGLPVTVLHLYEHATATMRGKLLSVATVVDAAGPEMDRSETVTVFNDLVVLAPGAIIDAPVDWTAVDADHVRGVYTTGNQSVAAILTFNAQHDLVDFTSHDRSRASADGTSFTSQDWSTPLAATRLAGGHRIPTIGEARWDAPAPEGAFTYLEFHLDDIHYNVRSTG
jgi:hypothetical protein